MNFLLFDAACLGTSAAVGIASGWWLKYLNFSRSRDVEDEERRAADEKRKAEAKEVMSQLQTLAASVAVQVGEHNSRVQEINSELTAPDGQGNDAVMAAINKLVEANNRMQEQLESAEKKLEEKSREIESRVSEARTDALTQINNRRAFDEEMQKCLTEFREQGRPSCVMMMDVDFFKKFNDTHGHKAGDEVLRHVARVVKGAIAHTEIACRYGGEEFAVIFPGSTLAAAKAGAERARAAIGATNIEFEGKSLQVNASAGLAEFQAGEDVEALLKRADDALYFSKKAGRNCGHYHQHGEFTPFVPKPKTEEPKPEVAPQPPVPAPAPKPAPLAMEMSDVLPNVAATRDAMTGLSSRSAFYDDCNRRIAEWKRGGAPLSLIFMQIDRLDLLIAEHGEEVESTIVKACAQFLQGTCRDMDHISRYDDNTFSMLLPTARVQNAASIAERIRKSVEAVVLPYKKGLVKFTVSMGVAEAIHGDGTNRLVQRGCAAANTAMNNGGNRTFVHNGERSVQVVSKSAALVDHA